MNSLDAVLYKHIKAASIQELVETARGLIRYNIASTRIYYKEIIEELKRR